MFVFRSVWYVLFIVVFCYVFKMAYLCLWLNTNLSSPLVFRISYAQNQNIRAVNVSLALGLFLNHFWKYLFSYSPTYATQCSFKFYTFFKPVLPPKKNHKTLSAHLCSHISDQSRADSLFLLSPRRARTSKIAGLVYDSWCFSWASLLSHELKWGTC